MVFLRLDDVTGGIDCVVFAAAYAAAGELCTTDRIIIVKGRVDHKEGETKLIAQEISAFESVAAKRTVRLRIDATKAAAGIIGELATLLREFPGESPVFVDCVTSQGPVALRLGPSSASSRTRTSTPRFARCSASPRSPDLAACKRLQSCLFRVSRRKTPGGNPLILRKSWPEPGTNKTL